jgi:putative ABC transport system permease protein
VLQFTIAIALMVGTIVVYRQLQFIRARDMGFDKSNLLYVALPISDPHIDMTKGAKLVDQGLAGVPGVAAHTVVSDLPTDLTSGDASVDWPGKDPRVQPIFVLLGADENFVPTFGAHLLKGRFFSKAFGNEDSNVVVNETALKVMHMDAATAVGKIIRYNGQQTTIIGVVRDFNFKPVQFSMEPLLLLPNFTRGYEFVVVKTEPGAVGRVIPMLEKQFRAVYSDYPFSYGFVDQDIDRLYASDQRMGHLFNVFCLLAVFISCLGLLGLSAYTTQRRAKEIGVRKVLGASVTGVVRLLAREFMAPVILAALIAFPLAGWAMAIWLDAFAYRIGLEWWIFAASGLLALFIALGTVSYHAINAALSNPVKTLRSE